MFHCRVFLATGAISLLMVLSPFGHAEVHVAKDYALNTEVQDLLANKYSRGECYAKVKRPSVRKLQDVTLGRVPEFKEPKEWIRVVCETDVTPHFLYWLEVRLSHIGVLDKQDIFTEGVKVNLDKRLYNAIEDFQSLRGLAVTGLSYETINVLSELEVPKHYQIK